jgi:hypothetical protein
MISESVFTSLFIICFGGLLFTGCLKQELPVHPHEPGSVSYGSADMGVSYKSQVYFQLKTNSIVGVNDKTLWDLGFETGKTGYHVVLNGAMSMYVLKTASADLTAISYADTIGFSLKKQCDSYKGSMDSTAIGDWRSSKPVFIVDRGFDETGKHQGWVKLQITSVSESGYSGKYASLDGSGYQEFYVKKDSNYNCSFLSLATNSQVMVEPPKAAWDLVFTQYTFVFYDKIPAVPYLVTGCLLNRYRTFAYADTVHKFEQTFQNVVSEKHFTNDISAIGYDWKVFNGSKYTIRSSNNYIVRTANGLLYKLHFTGFYNNAGVKGNPQWEYQQL